MSTELHTDSHNSRVTQGSATERKIEKPPFKLCFAKHPETGRSDACISKINVYYWKKRSQNHSRRTEHTRRKMERSYRSRRKFFCLRIYYQRNKKFYSARNSSDCRQQFLAEVDKVWDRAEFITPKFYSREADCIPDEDVIEEAKGIAKEETKTPKQLYRWPVLTSHTYGWWHDKGIRPIDDRFDFHKKTSDLVSFQMKIYSEDRKLKSLGR